MPKSETFNTDCLEYLRGCKDNQFSVAIIDPPYSSACLGVDGNTWKGKHGRFGGLFIKYLDDLSVRNNINHASGGKLFGKYDGELDAKNWDSDPPSEEFWEQIFRVCKWHIVWGGNYFPLPPSRNFIIWKKHIPENFSMAMVEYAWTDIPGNAKIVTYSPQDKFRFHPCLPAGEKVFFSGEWKNVEDVTIGEINQYGIVSTVSDHKADYVIEIFSNGFRTRATGNHPFLVLRNNAVYWVNADYLRVGDYLLCDYSLCGINNIWKEKRIWRQAGIKRKKVTSANGIAMGNSAWSISMFGKRIMELFRMVCKFITKMGIKQTIILRTSNLSIPLHIRGITQVADLSIVSGLNHVVYAGKCSRSRKKTGIFTSLVSSKEVRLVKYVKNAQLRELCGLKKFAAQRIDRLDKIDGEIGVYNLTIDGVPAFSTLVGESHNTQKPVALYSKIYEWYGNYCKGGVLDTFLGSGSNRIAAYDAGYDFVGIELNKVYFEKEKARFVDHLSKGNMFASAGISVGESKEGLF
jgi:site-specific DNA-methyltransferase (adenine-specific)